MPTRDEIIAELNARGVQAPVDPQKQAILDELERRGVKPPQPKQSLAERARNIYGESAGEMARIEAGYYPEQTAPEDLLQKMGQTAAVGWGVAGEALGDAVLAITPDEMEDYVAEKAGQLAQTEVGQEILGKMQEYGQDYRRFAAENPRIHRNLVAGLNVLGLAPAAMGGREVGKGAVKLAERYGPGAQRSPLMDVFKGTGEEVAGIQDKIGKLAEVRKQEYNDLYRQAEELGVDSYITKSSVDDVINRLKFQKEKLSSPEDIKQMENIIDKVQDSVIGGKLSTVTQARAPRKMNINKLEGIRKDLGVKHTDGKARSAIDEAILKAIDSGNIEGDPRVGQVYKDAISSFKNYQKTFADPKMNPTVKSIVDTDLTPEDLSSKLFGAGSIGSGRKAGQKYDEIVRVLGPEAEPELKKAVIGKVLSFANEPDKGTGDNMVWLQRVAREVSNLKSKNKSLWNKFDKDEQDALNRMAQTAMRSAEGGVANKAVSAILSLGNSVLARGGLRTDLRLPSTLQPKQLVREEDIIDLSREVSPTRRERLIEDLGPVIDKLKEQRG